MRKIAVAGIVAGSLTLGVGGTLAAQAATATNTSTTTNTLTSAKCYRHHATRSTSFHWVTKDNRYEVYPSAHKGTSDYTTCHK